jgi:DNA-binding CsgD family transcriptional regulator
VTALARDRFALPDADLARLATYLDERGEGNAFYIGELLQALLEEGVLRDDGAGWMLGDLAGVPVPPLLRQVIDRRLMRLGEEAQALFTVAAVIGQDVDFAVWGAVTGEHEVRLLAVVEQATAVHLVDAIPDGRGFRFVHALIRETLYEGMLPLRRRMLHRQAGEALAALPTPDPDAVAFHFHRAGDARATEWLVSAGERAQAASAWLTAAARYEAAAAMLASSGQQARERGWLLYRLATLRRFANPQASLGVLEEAARCATATGDAALAAHTHYYQGVMRCGQGDIRRGLPQLEAGLAAVERLPPAESARLAAADILERSTGRGTYILWLAYTGRFHDALQMGEQYVAEMAARAPDAVLHASLGPAYAGLASTYAHLGRPESAREAFAQAHAAYRAIDYPYHVGVNLLIELQLVVLPYQADQLAERARVVTAAAQEWARASDMQATLPAAVLRLPLDLLEGRWPTVGYPGRAPSARTSLGAFVSISVARLAYLRGDRRRAWSLVREWLPDGLATTAGEVHFVVAVHMQRLAAALALEENDRDTARAWLAMHDQWLAWSGSVLGVAEGHLGWAEYYRTTGNLRRALDHGEQARRCAMLPQQPLALLAAHRLLGALETEARQYGAAATHLEHARALDETCVAPFERSCTLLARAELRRATGDRAAALADVEAVRAACEPLGAAPTLAKATALARQLAADETPSPRHPAGLTDREVAVLQLIAVGCTNQEIAERLCVSKNTVMHHITHILTKTRTGNRAAAASFALRHHLA